MSAVVLVIAGLALEAALFAAGNHATTVAMLICLPVLELQALRATAHRAPAVVWIPVSLLGVVGLAGYLFYPSIATEASVSVQVASDSATYHAAADAFALAGAAFAVGAVAALGITPRRGTQRSAMLSEAASVNVRPGWLLLAGWLPLLLLVYGEGGALEYSPTYLEPEGPEWAVSAGSSLAIAAFLALAIAFFRTHGGTRLLALFGLVAWAVVFFAIATRAIAVIPAGIVVAYALSRSEKIRLWRLACAAVASVLSLNLALALRGNAGGVGLRPLTAAVLSDPSAFLRLDLGSAFGNVLFSVPLTGQVATTPTSSLNPSALWTSINPLPSQFTDWSTLSQNLRVNQFTPYNGLGELANHGPAALAVYFAAAGFLFAYLDATAGRLEGAPRIAGSLLLLGLATLFTFDMLQYNLRSGTRLLYYALVAVGLLMLFDRRRFPGGATPRSTRRLRAHGTRSGPRPALAGPEIPKKRTSRIGMGPTPDAVKNGSPVAGCVNRPRAHGE